jgi:RNA polymerase sigma factor (sigma-70 family)
MDQSQGDNMNPYLRKTSLKFDHKLFSVFQKPDAPAKFLGPIGLSLERPVPSGYGDNTTPFSGKDEELSYFRALHFVKYKMALQLEWNRLTPRVESLFYAIRNRIISANMGLIFGCIQRFSPKSQSRITHNQMLSEGHKSIIKAADCFNPFRGYRFSTYACGAILREFARLNNKPIREAATDPTLDNMSSLDSEFVHRREDGESLWLERLGFVLKENRADLTPDEVAVISCRFTEGKTYDQIASSMDTSKHHIMKIQRAAIGKLKMAMLADLVLV